MSQNFGGIKRAVPDSALFFLFWIFEIKIAIFEE